MELLAVLALIILILWATGSIALHRIHCEEAEKYNADPEKYDMKRNAAFCKDQMDKYFGGLNDRMGGAKNSYAPDDSAKKHRDRIVKIEMYYASYQSNDLPMSDEEIVKLYRILENSHRCLVEAQSSERESNKKQQHHEFKEFVKLG